MIDQIPSEDDLLPEEVEARERAKEEALLAKLEAFGVSLAHKREEAISGRYSSGIEQEWMEDEEAYQGIDDANRDTSITKPRSPNGSSYNPRPKEVRSTVFLNITRPYVDAASAKVADMLLPTDDRNWGIKPTPIPDLELAKQDQTPIMTPMGQPAMMQMQDPATGQPMQRQMTIADRATQIMDQANKAAQAAERRIEDWLVECQYHAEVRKAIEDCSRLGTGILKGPYPVVRKHKRVKRGQGITAIELVQTISPATKRVDPWNFYPDPSCGENIHDGSFVFEKDSFTAKQLRDLVGSPGYLQSQIEQILEEGPGKKYVGTNERTNDKDRFEVWYYHGVIDAEDMELAGVKVEDKTKQIPAIIVLVNDRIIKAAINPLDSGEFPYDVMPWQRRTDSPFGVGVARQVRTPQRMLNAATRNMMDNAGLSAGPQLVMRRGLVEPADGSWTLTPRKVWYVSDEGDTRSVAEAFAAINIPTLQNELMAIIQFAAKMAEDVTGLPMLLQGQQGAAPETVGGMQMLSNNASSVLRRIARTFDDKITEPHIRRYYEWLLLYGEDEKEKGDFSVDARGSSALVERDIQNQWIVQMLNFAVPGNAYKIDPAKAFEEASKSQKFDPKRVQYTEEEWQQLQQQMAQAQPQDPQLQVAQIRAQADVQKTQAQAAADQAEIQFRAKMAQDENIARMAELQLQREIAMLKLAADQKISLEKIKAQLTDTAIKEKNKRELFTAEQNLKQQMGSGI